MPDVTVQVNGGIVVARELQTDEVRVLFQRHVEHTDNVADSAALDAVFDQGVLIAAQGYWPDKIITSPAPRAIWSGLSLISGMRMAILQKKNQDKGCKLPNFDSETTLGDFGTHAPAELVARVKAYRAASDLSGDDALWQFLAEDAAFLAEIRRRGMLASTAIIKVVTERMEGGQTCLMPSHGLSVMETAISYLTLFGTGVTPTDDQIINPEHKLQRGQIVELIFGTEQAGDALDALLLEANYFPVP